MTTPSYLTVDPQKAMIIKSLPPRRAFGPRPLSPLTKAIYDGEMVFTTNLKWKPANKYLADHNMILRQRTDDGGRYFWAEPRV